MHPQSTSRPTGQRRPRLLRASVTEPSIFTSSVSNHGALNMSQPTSTSGSSSPISGGSTYHRRATDLLNHVAYLSSCATSPVSSLVSSSPIFDRMTPRRTLQSDAGHGSSSASVRSASRSHSIGHAGSGSGNGHNGGSGSRTTSATADACRRRDVDEVFGSSPASTHTSSSLDDLHSRSPCSANYYSFPSFDTWDPDHQDKEDDVDG